MRDQPVSSAPLEHERSSENKPTPLVLRGLYKAFISFTPLPACSEDFSGWWWGGGAILIERFVDIVQTGR